MPTSKSSDRVGTDCCREVTEKTQLESYCLFHGLDPFFDFTPFHGVSDDKKSLLVRLDDFAFGMTEEGIHFLLDIFVNSMTGFFERNQSTVVVFPRF